MYAQKGDNLNIMENKELALHAKNIRRNIVKEVYSAQSGHPGGSLGATDILTELYFEEMDINEENLNTLNRDRFVLSKDMQVRLYMQYLLKKDSFQKKN